MRVNVVRIGNSKGIRIPKAILGQCEISEAVDMVVEGRRIILTPAAAEPRRGWRAAAERMRDAQDDGLLIPDVFEDDLDVEC